MFAAPSTYYQNGTTWQIELCRDDGTRLKIIDTAGPFQVNTVANNVGSWWLNLPQGFDKTLIARDRRVLFWRRPAGGSMYLEFEGLIRKITTQADEYGNVTRVIGGPSLEGLLTGRVVNLPKGWSTSTISAPADNLIKAFVQTQMGTLATTTRQISSSLFSVQSATSSAPTISKSFGWRNVLDVAREACDAARQYGTETYFEMVPTGATTFEFRTMAGQPGSDRTGSGNALIFGQEYGNLRKPTLIEDWSYEANYCYSIDSNQAITTAYDSTRGAYSLFSMREASVRGTVDDARAKVVSSRPALTFTGELLSVPRAVYGLDWKFGDRVTITFDGRQFSALIRAVTINVDENGYESITSLVEAYL